MIADAAEHELKEELESERASVLHALQMLEPELQKLAGQSKETDAAPSPPATELCRARGHAFVGNETSCGVCGASRATGLYPGAALQSKWALLWERHLSDTEQGGMPVFRKQPPQNEILPAEDSPSDSDGKADVYDKGGSRGCKQLKP